MSFTVLVDYVADYYRKMETEFILNPDTSSLDLLPDAQKNRYRNFEWHRYDYIGGPKGPNEKLAKNMITDLNRIRPERRVNTGPTAILTEKKYNAAIEKYIIGQLQPIPDFDTDDGYKQPSGKKLNQYALKDFLRMREDALQDDVPIIVRDAYRPPKVAARNAARSGNANAVAKFSVHMLGLAIDLNMSYKIGDKSRRYSETSTKPMQNVVDMRESPVHKWLFLRGRQYGWFPFQQEPWHWEYNPPGFQELYFSKLKSA